MRRAPPLAPTAAAGKPGSSGSDIRYLTPGAPDFDAGCAAVGALFARREAEFAFNPAIRRATPDPEALAADPEAFLAAPAAVVLTTWAEALRAPLAAAGFAEEPVPWPAGPATTSIFRREGAGPLSYLEVVNEADPRLAPAHLAMLGDGNGLVGGAICAITGDAAWLAVMAVAPGAPAGTGTRLWHGLAADLARRGIRRVDLGTQTAERFYLRQGFTTTTRAVAKLRAREGQDGRVWSDLVMMTATLRPAALTAAAPRPDRA